MNRRQLLSAAGAAAVLTIVPRSAHAAWLRVLAGERPLSGLTESQLALVAALADAIIPRTETPGATDVGVPDWVNLIVSEYYTDVERAPFVSGLDTIAAQVRGVGADTFSSLPRESQDRLLGALDRPDDRQAPAARAFNRLKGLVVHGYFTSERVQKEVLKTEIMPGRFEGAASMPPAGRGSR